MVCIVRVSGSTSSYRSLLFPCALVIVFVYSDEVMSGDLKVEGCLNVV